MSVPETAVIVMPNPPPTTMASQNLRAMAKALAQPEIVGLILEKLSSVQDLLNCACVNIVWNCEALRKLYYGSLYNMQFCSPDIGSLNCLLVADRNRFARNMSFTKHLLICPDTLAVDEPAWPTPRLGCMEKCRAVRRRQDAELLFQPRRKGLSSVSIPVELVDQDLSHISDFLVADNIKYLAVDITYCNLLVDRLRYLQQSTHLTGMAFSHLQALTIYYAQIDDDVAALCEVLQNCSLQFLHLENQTDTRQSDIVNNELLLRIKQQRRLKTLALKSIHCNIFGRSEDDHSTNADVGVAWPSLKAVYIRGCHQLYFKQLPKFKGLQIIVFERAAPTDDCLNHTMIENVSMCQNLLVLDLGDYKIKNASFVPRLAHGCTQLRKLCLGRTIFTEEENDLARKVFKELIHALPYLEYLTLRWECRMGPSMLSDLASYSPLMVVLNLPQMRLCLSLTDLKQTCPLLKLEAMELFAVWFEGPQRLLEPDEVQHLAVAWRQTFPSLRTVPCPGDEYSEYWENDINTTKVYEDVGNDEMAYKEPAFDFADYNSPWFVLRVMLWKSLGYKRDSWYDEKLRHMWQAYMEMATIVWPVVPFQAFLEPALYNTRRLVMGYLSSAGYASASLSHAASFCSILNPIGGGSR